jgi:hypothetical protein
MEKIFDRIEKINDICHTHRNEKKIEIKGCYFCKEKIAENYFGFNLIVDDKEVFVCENCTKDEECKKMCYCHNCENDIEPYSYSYYCTKCPEEISVLCKKCYKLHDILTKNKIDH